MYWNRSMVRIVSGLSNEADTMSAVMPVAQRNSGRFWRSIWGGSCRTWYWLRSTLARSQWPSWPTCPRSARMVDTRPWSPNSKMCTLCISPRPVRAPTLTKKVLLGWRSLSQAPV